MHRRAHPHRLHHYSSLPISPLFPGYCCIALVLTTNHRFRVFISLSCTWWLCLFLSFLSFYSRLFIPFFLGSALAWGYGFFKGWFIVAIVCIYPHILLVLFFSSPLSISLCLSLVLVLVSLFFVFDLSTTMLFSTWQKVVHMSNYSSKWMKN